MVGSTKTVDSPRPTGWSFVFAPPRSGAFTGGPMSTGLMRELATDGAEVMAIATSGADTWTVLRRSRDRAFVLYRQGREETVTWARTLPDLLLLLQRFMPAPAMAELAWKLLARVCKAG